MLQQPCHASVDRCPGGHLWLRFSCPFVLKQKDQKFKADIKGLPHLATAPPPCRPGPRTQPGWSLAFPLSVSFNGLYPTLPSSAKTTAQRTVHSDTRIMKRVCLVLCRKSIMPIQQPSPPPRRATHSSTRSGMRRLPLCFDFALSTP